MSGTPRPQLVAIDTDPGIDDALALMLALRSPELQVELITTVAGNVTLDTATANAQRLLALIDPASWPSLAQGASRPLRRPLYTSTHVHRDDGLGGITHLRRRDGTPHYPLPEHFAAGRQGVQRLIRLAHAHGCDLTIVSLGPLTNIARAVQQAPETMRQIGRLIIMGGAIGVSGNVTPTAEFNIFVDPHAADIVFKAGLSITLVPLDVTRQVRLTQAFLRQTVPGSGTKLARAIRQMTRHMLRGPSAGMPMHDPLAVAVAIDPSLVRCTRLPLRVETRGQHTLGMTVADQRDPARWAVDAPLVDVALDVNAEQFFSLFAERVLAPHARHTGHSAPRTQAGVIVVGSANTDLTIQVPHLPQQGETVIGATLQTAFGGKGANQALAARRAGAHVVFVGKLGRDTYGEDLVAYLRGEGVHLSGVRWDEHQPSGVGLIVVDRRGQNQIAVASGANATFTPEELDGLPALLTTGNVLVVQLENPLATVEAALRHAKKAGLTTVLNPAPARRLPTRLTPLIDILVPNEVEAAMLCGRVVKTPRQAMVAARTLRGNGYGTVVITLGKQGLVYTAEPDPVHLPGIAVQARDATAAGDTFIGYFACALAEGRPLPEALTFANKAAALSVTRAGAMPSIPQRYEVEQHTTAQ